MLSITYAERRMHIFINDKRRYAECSGAPLKTGQDED